MDMWNTLGGGWGRHQFKLVGLDYAYACHCGWGQRACFWVYMCDEMDKVI